MHGEGDEAILDRDWLGFVKAKQKAESEETRYFGLDKTKPITVKDGFVIFTMHFKYLGSFISYNLGQRPSKFQKAKKPPV